jgi:cyclopropane fatty-acyl-phospholipid synthase-like methyltransferase
VSGFDNPRETWNTRYAGSDFLFGEEPNAFVRRSAHWLRPGCDVLCVADGEGRNSIWLAEQGFRVTAFDFAPNAVAKAKALAARRGVRAEHRLSDWSGFAWNEARYDAVVAIFIQFLAPDVRDDAFAQMQRAVAPDGVLLLEGYRPEQVDYGTGGPPRRDHMYTREWLEQRFAGWEMLALDEYDADIREGAAHGGMSALIDLVARKPRRDARESGGS